MNYDLIIIGGGAAGLYAASRVTGGNVLLLEKMDRPGLKVLASGGGQCNFCHEGRPQELLTAYHGSPFPKFALKALTTEGLRAFFDDLGVPSVVREDGKVFPKSLKASDLVAALRKRAVDGGVQVRTTTAVTGVSEFDGYFTVKTEEERYSARQVILATGGFTYPQLGSSGDGYAIARAMGHRIVPPRPALAPIEVKETWIHKLAGIAVAAKLLDSSGRRSEGDLLFTHDGLSGPLILDHAGYLTAGETIRLDFWREDLEKQLIGAAAAKGASTVAAWFADQEKLPGRLLTALLGNLATKRLGDLTKKERAHLVERLTSHPLQIHRIKEDRAMVTRGGIALEEVNPKTMESKRMPGLYFAGEVMDVDGRTGGYNLHFAFASAHLALQAIEKKKTPQIVKE
jgi:predicted Rossmann fold flavoprotein